MKKIYAKEEYCIGCRICELSCVTAHSKYPYSMLKAFKNDQMLPKSRVVVEAANPISFALNCRHCQEQPCVKACITGAMQKTDSGYVINQEDRCVGCWTCILVCPYGAIQRDTREKKVASKCDFCISLEKEPACVANCPNRALVIEDVKEGD